MAKRIPLGSIKEAYKIAVAVYKKQLSKTEGRDRLIQINQLNGNTATDIINNISKMLHGEEFIRTNSSEGTDYYLTQIHNDFGIESLRLAIQSVQLHLSYYEKLKGNPSQKGIRKIIAIHAKKIGTPLITFEQVNKQLEKEVDASLSLSSEKRKKLIANVSPVPKKIEVMTYVYHRNPNVIAEALYLADGMCGQCNQKAPFNVASTGRPYLEVHHIIRLADKGLDSIENVIALCPNCHRKAHFG